MNNDSIDWNEGFLINSIKWILILNKKCTPSSDDRKYCTDNMIDE